MKLIAIHLPQFHPIPENDAWWGRGFTEWTNVTKARPRFPGHYQPHLPADLGFYDLRLPEARAAQAALAAEHGIGGFCYYHYWFNGHRLLNRPVDEIVSSGEPDFPFCLCWANENWTRVWDGGANQILMQQNYTDEDDLAHIRHLVPILADRRYLRVDGRPILLVYRTELMPDPRRTADIWRREVERAGLPGLYLVRVESFNAAITPEQIGFDAALEFAPDWRLVQQRAYGRVERILAKLGLFPDGKFKNRIFDYPQMVDAMLSKPQAGYRRIRSVTPSWDNSSRRAEGATIFLDSTPERYGDWLRKTIDMERLSSTPLEDQMVFINAWNEWAEGNHLEPDQRWGRGYLEATASALGRESV